VSRLGIRRRLLLAVVAVVAGAVVALVVGFNLILAHTLYRDAHDLARTRAGAQVALLRTENGRLSVGEAPDEAAADTFIWVFSNGRTLEQPRSSPRVGAAARTLAGGPARFLDVPAADVRLYAEPVVANGRRLGTVVAGISLTPYEETRRVALRA
jgi:hypothetical protein